MNLLYSYLRIRPSVLMLADAQPGKPFRTSVFLMELPCICPGNPGLLLPECLREASERLSADSHLNYWLKVLYEGTTGQDNGAELARENQDMQ